MRNVNRITPALPVQMYKTYQATAPLQSHFRKATCAEVECSAHLNGWKTVVDESTDLGQQQAHYIRQDSGRRYVREPINSDGPVVYTFEPGQECFREHHVPLERTPLYIVKDGDWRMSTNARRHANAEDWIDDFATHQDQLATRLERG